MGYMKALPSRTRNAAGLGLLLLLLLLHDGQAEQTSRTNGWTHVECARVELRV